MADKKKNGKFVTSIIIGGALGSLVAWVFGNKRRRDTISGRAQEYYESTKEKIEHVMNKPEPKKGFFERLFGRRGQ